MTTAKTEDIVYEVVRSRRSTADVIIERDGSVTVRAPKKTSDAQIAGIVRSKRHWIYSGLAEWRDLNTTRVLREYRNGEGFLYLGRSYRLQLAEQQDAPVLLKDGRFVLRRGLVDRGKMASAKAAFREFYIAKGNERIPQRVLYYSPKVGVNPTGTDVRELGHRWASCSPKGRLSFHWKCMMAPQTIIDYIVVHELCHLHHRDHTQAFWNEVDKVLPDFRERKEWLRRNGAGLDV